MLKRDIDWVFLEVHAEGEAEHAAIGHSAVLNIVPQAHRPILRQVGRPAGVVHATGVCATGGSAARTGRPSDRVCPNTTPCAQAMADHDRDFAVFYNRMADLLLGA